MKIINKKEQQEIMSRTTANYIIGTDAIRRSNPTLIASGDSLDSQGLWKPKEYNLTFSVRTTDKNMRTVWRQIFSMKQVFDVTHKRIPRKRKKQLKRMLCKVFGCKKVKFRYPKL